MFIEQMKICVTKVELQKNQHLFVFLIIFF